MVHFHDLVFRPEKLVGYILCLTFSEIGIWEPNSELPAGRGLSDETIRKAALGYHPGAFRAPASQWGRTIWLAQGIVIPWIIEGAIWRVTIRDDRVTEGNRRYLQVSGGSNGLYLAQSLLLKRQAVVLVEGEFDALSVAQECGDLVAVVATGTTKGSHTPRWVSLWHSRSGCLWPSMRNETKGMLTPSGGPGA